MQVTEFLSADALAIFLFHGVIERSPYTVRNYNRKHLLKSYFYACVKELKQTGHPLSMDEVVEYHLDGVPYPPRSFVVTFDDGFENNCSVAAPILDALGIPAMFYITTGFVNDNQMSWIDRIEYCLENVAEGRLKLPWKQEEYRFRTAGEKIALLEQIRKRVKNDPTIDVTAFVSSCFSQCRMEEVGTSFDPLDLKMSWQQVAQLNAHDGFGVGGHTHRHPILAFCDQGRLEDEIGTSLKLLIERAGVAPLHYSYPEGLRHCYSEPVIHTLQKYGVVCCPTAEMGVNHYNDSLFHLKRIPVC